MRLKLIACEILYRELCYLTAVSPHCIDVEFLPKGLHDIGCEQMCAKLQDSIDRVADTEIDYDYILLGYALCNNGIAGLKSRNIPLVIPRAHDCITLFLGSKERYREYFDSHPGVYFLTSGWIERDDLHKDLKQISVQAKFGMDLSYSELIEKYGEDNAKFLYDTLCDTVKNYTQYTYIYMGVEPRHIFEQKAVEMAKEKSWKFEAIDGDISLLKKLTEGCWEDDEFLIINPGETIIPAYDDNNIIKKNTG